MIPICYTTVRRLWNHASGISNATKDSVVIIEQAFLLCLFDFYHVINGTLFTCGPQFLMWRIYAWIMVLRVCSVEDAVPIYSFLFLLWCLICYFVFRVTGLPKISLENPEIFDRTNIRCSGAFPFFLILSPHHISLRGWVLWIQHIRCPFEGVSATVM